MSESEYLKFSVIYQKGSVIYLLRLPTETKMLEAPPSNNHNLIRFYFHVNTCIIIIIKAITKIKI